MKKFEYKKLKYRFIKIWKKKWCLGFFIKNNNININEGATCINYSQQCFEGIKVCLKKKKIKIKKININSNRFQKSCKLIMSPIINLFYFINIIKILSILNFKYIPNIKIGYLYLRPLILGISKNIGVKTSEKFFLTIFCTPLFTKNIFLNIKSVFSKRIIDNYGNYKIGSNYIINIINNYYIKKYNFDDYIHVNNFFFEEIGTSNFIIYKKKLILSPNNKNILPGINKFFFLYFLKFKKKIFKLNINFNKINNSKKIISCGTAAYYKIINLILYKNKILKYKKNFFYKLLHFFIKKYV
ncbi:branched chain amino acid aminotransferase [Candidatus Carsonella ruddii]|uniref:Branched-chain amino acid aminotransferase n=1 Tax=Candidatus Carsonella ruddii HC isolate Thao2000 TaxID=1202538 RepID=J3Z1B8_CARRU|nr:branched chain amino acid aminotransferase [Candidatus Carsonella ruddii]AFP84039.1 branched-chain amino acid aminotransferase [Candidatus Carsonella ruddii HC isolate Thao2000]